MSTRSLTDCLELAVASPQQVQTESGGAYVALALHCLMVRADFIPTHIASSSRASPSSSAPLSSPPTSSHFPPPLHWDKQPSLDDAEWIFEYRRRGLLNSFALHLSLQKETRRLFVQATERLAPPIATLGASSQSRLATVPIPRRDNIQMLGLDLNNYLVSPTLIKTALTWPELFRHEDRMCSLFDEHIVRPLVKKALTIDEEDESMEEEGRGWGKSFKSWWEGLQDPSSSSLLIPGMALVTFISASAAAYLLYRMRTNHHQ